MTQTLTEAGLLAGRQLRGATPTVRFRIGGRPSLPNAIYYPEQSVIEVDTSPGERTEPRSSLGGGSTASVSARSRIPISGSFAQAARVAELVVADFDFAAELPHVIIGDTRKHSILGRQGGDFLIGGRDRDVFLFNSSGVATDTIMNFTATNLSSCDIIFSAIGTNFSVVGTTAQGAKAITDIRSTNQWNTDIATVGLGAVGTRVIGTNAIGVDWRIVEAGAWSQVLGSERHVARVAAFGADSWYSRSAKIVESLEELQDGWAGEDSIRPIPGIVDAIGQVALCLPASTRMPEVDVDSSSGTVSLNWWDRAEENCFSLVFPSETIVIGITSKMEHRPQSWRHEVSDEAIIADEIERSDFALAILESA